MRQAIGALPANDMVFDGLLSMLLRCKADEIEMNPAPRFETPQLVPALFAACARAPLSLQARQLERLSLWLRLCPSNCDALTATASLWQPHAGAILAAALDSDGLGDGWDGAGGGRPSGGADSADAEGGALCGMYMIELLCTYAIEVLAAELDELPGRSTSHSYREHVPRRDPPRDLFAQRDGSARVGWRALDMALVVTQAAWAAADSGIDGEPQHVHRARRMLLHRLLASLVRLGPRFAHDASTAVPKLLRLCVIVRAHLLQPPPPPPPVAVRLSVVPAVAMQSMRVGREVGSGGPAARDALAEGEAVGGAAARLRLSVRPPFDAAALTAAERWTALRDRCGEHMVSADVSLLLQLLSALDAMTVRAMMDDVADAAMRRPVSSDAASLTLSALVPSTAEAPGGLAQAGLAGLQGAAAGSFHGLAGSLQGIAGRLKGLAIASPRPPPLGTPTPPPPPAGAAMSTPLASSSRSTGVSESSAESALGNAAAAAANANTLAAGAGTNTGALGGGGGLPGLVAREVSLYDVLLQLLLALVQAPAGTFSPEDTEKVRVATRQRLRELIWRDLEQGCQWAHLSSERERAAQSAEAHWQNRRDHIFGLLVALAAPLRAHALALRESGTAYNAVLAETLVPLLQGVLRTYRHFLAMELAPPTPSDGSASARVAESAVDGSVRAGYGQLTVLAGQLGGVEPPAWMAASTPPRQFIEQATPQWGPLLDSPPLALFLRRAYETERSAALHAVLTTNMWADAGLSGWAIAAAEEESQSTAAAAMAEGALTRLRNAENARAAAADAREAKMASQAARTWDAVQRSLVREQAAWEAPGSSGGVRLWEHLEIEESGPGRRRWLFAPNPNGSDHAAASAVQQASGGSMPWPKHNGSNGKGDEEGGESTGEGAIDGQAAGDGESSEQPLDVKLRRAASLARQASLPSSHAAARREEGEEGEEGEDEDEHEDDADPMREPRTPARSLSGSSAEGRAASAGREQGGHGAGEAPGGVEGSSKMEPKVAGSGEGLEENWDYSMLYHGACKLVWRGGVVSGTVSLSRTTLAFDVEVSTDDGSANAAGSGAVGLSLGGSEHSGRGGLAGGMGAPGSRVWAIPELRQMQRRRYLLMHTALELFIAPAQSVASAVPLFFQFHTKRRREAFRRALRRVGVPERTWRASRAALLEAWQRREISNFDYLMELNTLAGRSYNDLNQYPVFPWILADYTSASLDLNNDASYRDLSKPVGALNAERLAQVVERYDSMDPDDAELPRFHYGSHYSSSAATLFWLLRIEPYTALHVELQSGRFDHADRLFYSLQEAWSSCNTSIADVKELIPEFFYLPDFLRNDCRFELGVRQDGKTVDEVKLPPWAESAEQFVALHRRALESEIVSANLHHWIDLIFGHKQVGPAAEAAANVFFHLTYEGSVDLEAVSDPAEREALTTQVACFGQTPPQLFAAAHPPRRAALPFVRPLHWGPADPATFPGHATALSPPPTRPFVRVPLRLAGAHTGLALSGIGVCGELGDRRVVAIDANSTVHTFRWPPQAGREPQVASARRHCSTQLPASDSSRSACAALVPATDGSRAMQIVSGGHFDGALCIASEAGRTLHVEIQHSRTITCLAQSARGDWLITGSADTTVIIWYLRTDLLTGGANVRPLRFVRALRGHVRELTAVALAVDLGLAASGAADGCVLLHATRDGSLLRSIAHPDTLPVGHLQISSLHGRVVLGSSAAGTAALHVFSLSGVRLFACELLGGVRCATLSPDGALLLAGGVRGDLAAWRLDTGQPAGTFGGVGAAVACACVCYNELLVGTQEGDVLGYALDPQALFGAGQRDVASWAS